MPTISGSLKYVTDRPAAVAEVWVRARELRTDAGGVVTTSNDRAPVVDGQVSFDALPGPAILVLVESGNPVDTIPIVVGDVPTQSLETVVLAAEVATDAQRDILEKLAAQVATDAEVARSQRVAAEGARDEAKKAQTDAENAAESAAEDATASVQDRLAGLVSDAQTAADASADAARVEVAKVVDGAPESLDTLREVAEKLANQDDVAAAMLEQIGTKASKQELADGLAGKADASHTHTTAQVTGLDAALAGKASTQALMDGLATRVDGGSAVKKIEVVASMPSSPVATTLYLVVG
nr:hypothetical protein [Corynebacterium sp. UBA5992]